MSATQSTEQHLIPNRMTRSHFWLNLLENRKILVLLLQCGFLFPYTLSSLYSIKVAGITKNISANALTAGCQTDSTVQMAVMIAMPALNLFLKIGKSFLVFHLNFRFSFS